MNDPEDRSELHPDPRLRRLLEQVEPGLPTDRVDWDALRLRVRERAAFELAARRRRSTPSGGRWWRAAVPLAAAAGVTGVAYLGVQRGADAAGAAAAATPVRAAGAVTAEEALRADLSDREFSRLVSGGADAEAWLLLAVDDG